jgi:hypothetical protein
MATIVKTDELLGRVNNEFVGYQVEQPLMTYIDNTETTDLIIGSVTSGHKIMARGSCKIVSLTGHTGDIKLKIDDEDASQFWKTYPTLNLEFRYESWTHGEKWIYPGGAFVDNVWDNSYPQGTIRAVLSLQPQQNGKLRLEIVVDADHDDRPGHFIRGIVAPALVNRLDWIVENMTNTSVDT